MSDSCSPMEIEIDLDVDDEILYDAIRLSGCASWLLRVDILDKFSIGFRKRLFDKFEAFGKETTFYFHNKCEKMKRQDLIDEYMTLNQMVSFLQDGAKVFNPAINLINPVNMLANENVHYDDEVISGNWSLREMLIRRIKIFIDTANKSEVDFSKSLFLIDILNPKFFCKLSEAEQLVIASNIDKYFEMLSKVRDFGLYILRRKNIPLILVKHILSSNRYGIKVRDMIWNKFYSMLLRKERKGSYLSPIVAFYDKMKIEPVELSSLTNLGVSRSEYMNMLIESEGVFEAFELECTLKNLNSIDFMMPISVDEKNWKMIDGLLKFQDEKTRENLYMEFASYLGMYT